MAADLIQLQAGSKTFGMKKLFNAATVAINSPGISRSGNDLEYDSEETIPRAVQLESSAGLSSGG